MPNTDQQEVRGINKHLLAPAPFEHIGFITIIIIIMNSDKYFILTIRCSVFHMCVSSSRLDHGGEQWLKPGGRKCKCGSVSFSLKTKMMEVLFIH